MWVVGIRYPILHLPLWRYERFKGETERLESLLLEASAHGWQHVLFSRPELLRELLKDDIPRSAAVALAVSPDDVVTLGAHPAELLSVVISQWLHNLEVEDVRKCFPMPPDDDEPTPDIEGDPTESNPLAMIERLASGFHWTFASALEVTMPQMYLLSNSSAWTWHKHDRKRKDEPGSGAERAPERKKTAKPIHKMTAKEYREHVREIAHILG